MFDINLPEVHNELEAVRAKHGGALHPADVVAAARSKKSALHDHFTWDDAEAAQAHRLWEARQLIARVRIEYTAADDKPRRTRAYVSISGEDNRSYFPSTDIAEQPDLRDRYIAQLKADLKSLRRKLADFESFAGVVSAIDAALEEAA